MLPSPSSSPRVILEDRINITITPPKHRKFSLPTPPKESSTSRKRPAKNHANDSGRKRTKISKAIEEEVSEESEEEDPSLFEEESEEEDVFVDARAKTRRPNAFRLHSTFASTSAHKITRLNFSTRPILESFVSGLKTDIYTCQAVDVNSFLTPPYACSYSHAAKHGGSPLLAVATEEGSVRIINTSKRNSCEPEPSRTIFQPHENGVFDVKWNRTDTQIATSSGDHTVRISSVKTQQLTHVLQGHTSTVKTVAWDPANDALLASGGRDGAIRLWDLRTQTSQTEDGIYAVNPVVVIPDAHEDPTKAKIRKSKKHVPVPKTVTSLIYPDGAPYGLISSGAFDGILRFWDLRKPETPRRPRSTKPRLPLTLYSSPLDPTTLLGSKRPRGIISLVQGTGPTAGLIFGLSQDSKIHTFTLPTLSAQPTNFADVNLQSNSFYVGLSLSPCGSWLASGASGHNSGSGSFLFDVGDAGRASFKGNWETRRRAVKLQGQKGEVGAVDWADGMLATCADDGTVRVWRPDVEVYRHCLQDPDDAQWDWCWSKQVA